MVWKCCVPGCKSGSKFPAHKIPKDQTRAREWLKAIQRIDLIDASKEELAKLRICSEHFPDDMILTYTQRRVLVNHAIPTLHLQEQSASDNNIIIEDAPENITENVQNNSYNVQVEIHKDVSVEKETYTSHIRHLRNTVRRYKDQLNRKKVTISRQRRRIAAQRRAKKNNWEELTQNFSGIQETFMEMVSTNFKNLPQGHRYTAKHKAVALTLYKTMGKRAYKSLRCIFKELPSIQTLQLVLQKIPICTRVNTLIFRHLKNISSKMSEKDKVCILMWDEVSIQPKVSYDIKKDIICGLEDWGSNRTAKVADHSLVFMLRGLYSGWKMPLSYSFCSKQTNTAQLMRCIKNHIKKISQVGFYVVATVCDQGTSNVAAINELLLRTEMKRNFEKQRQRQTFEVGDAEIIPLYDPPHLIKGIRNNLLTKDLATKCNNGVPSHIASWDIIKIAWYIDKTLNTIRPQMKKLTKAHVEESKIKKMRVKHATQVLSGTVASCIETLTRLKCVVPLNEDTLSINAEEGLATAEAVNFFNNLFDSVNGSNINENELRCPVTENSAHHDFWINAKHMLREIHYVNKVTHEVITFVPSLKNWMFTIDGFQKLWTTLNIDYGFQNFKTRYCNQDPIENFFGQIRSHAVRNTNPTPRQFEQSFIALLVSNMKSLSIIGGNCEITNDDCMLFSLEESVSNVPCDEVDGVDSEDEMYDEPYDLFTNNIGENSKNIVAFENLEDIIVAILKKLNCTECETSLRNSKFATYAKQIIVMFTKLLKTRSHRHNILQVLLQHIHSWNVKLDWCECTEHSNEMFKIVAHAIGMKVLVCWCERKNIVMHESDNSLRSEANFSEEIVKLKRMRNIHKEQRNLRKRALQDYRESVRKRVKM